MNIYDETCCTLGEGPLWHPERKELFWFDILSKRLHVKGRSWDFPHYVSAAGWAADDKLLVASAVGLHLFDIENGNIDDVAPMEADNPVTRSNDGRADPYGGFWIGTMGIKAEHKAGAYYRYYKGELRELFPNISIPNATCFSPDGSTAYFGDTPEKKVWKVALDSDGWPKGDPEVLVDMDGTPHKPDGAVCDSAGNLWIAEWGSHRVAVHGADGTYLTAIGLPPLQTSCPAFGGAEMSTLFVTSAAEGLDDPLNPHHGRTFMVETTTTGQAEHQVIL
ncbi:SMP-30/gluconolactonase/LRE family protein [Pelagovum pacificum]|uniref:SMP-30/gluconolactonase/LRE family protein n=1 Tax=Pelagovum pacificum TaxID=2588711 RepID=A0A5C5GBK4_9RHOB|nr:SMP-30/gluconolactonase/LRE family protein [Pelagovum pacificum]QQA42384.1 SMP-30/gluconolactonase/LRE family protein [Pelagovum pacificum]TNY31467.1 SMP-30/gluconolactonase/LRE family protein [Pelagovum pacificum]